MSVERPKLTLLRADRIIDGKSLKPIKGGACLLQGGEIMAVGEVDRVRVPDGYELQTRFIDYHNCTILPGLVDCHVHLVGFGDGRLGDELAVLPDEVLSIQAARNAAAHLFAGVTTIRDCGGKHQTTFMLRKAVAMGITPAPNLLLCGRPMAIVGGHLGYFGIEATGTDECRAAVRQLIKEGADFIKISATGGSTLTSFRLYPSFTMAELQAICDEAHKFERHVVAHCASSKAMRDCIEAGVDSIAHANFKEADGSRVFRADIADLMVERGIYVHMTLYAYVTLIDELEERKRDHGLDASEQAELDEALRDQEHFLQCFRRLRERGVKLVCGSDSAWDKYEMGGFQHEIAYHVSAGMNPMEAIIASTSESAASCRVGDIVGSLEPGKRGDILVVRGNPLEDIQSLWQVEEVFKDGESVAGRNMGRNPLSGDWSPSMQDEAPISMGEKSFEA